MHTKFKLGGAAMAIALVLIPGVAMADLSRREQVREVFGGGDDSPVISAPVIDVTPDYTPVDIGGTQIETPGVIYPKTVTYKPTIEFVPGATPAIAVAVACQVAGTPVEFPDDLVLINQGAALSAGTVIKWKVKTAGEGFVELGSDLPTGATMKAKGVLGGGVEAGLPCTAKIV